MVETPVKTIRDLSCLAQTALDIGTYFKLSEEDMKNPNTAKYLIEEFRNFGTSIVLKMQLNIKTRIQEDVKRNPVENFTDSLLGKNTT